MLFSCTFPVIKLSEEEKINTLDHVVNANVNDDVYLVNIINGEKMKWINRRKKCVENDSRKVNK